MRGLVWFREDLRVGDNTALYHASLQSPSGIVGVYFIDPHMWKKHDVAACRVEFTLRGLHSLQVELEKLHIPLLCISLQNSQSLPQELLKIAEKYHIHALFYNRQYELDESRRDEAVEKYLKTKQIACYGFDDQTILAPGTVKTGQGNIFKIFTPYKQAWQKAFMKQNGLQVLPKPKRQKPLNIHSSQIPHQIAGFSSQIDSALWPAGENIARKLLRDFIKKNLFLYEKQRDFPSIDGTSQLSPYLATGMVSARQCFAAALKKNNQQLTSGNAGALAWLSELVWREFYKHLLAAIPRLSMNKPFNLYTEQLPWHNDKKALKAWQSGKTGFPIIDAAMRQLNETGWMHNRLRMIVAMFLSRNLFLDWRLGEIYFMTHLIDGDLAANNGGWQWCAATGADIAPYFRVFNPIRQSERFDPEGQFIRRYCSELNILDNYQIHDPWGRAPDLAKKLQYPARIIDLEKSKKIFIEAYKNCLYPQS